MSSEVNSEEILNKLFFSQYKALGLIGEGSFGKCFKGINIKNNEEICFKIEKKSSQKTFLKIESQALENLKGGKGIPDFYLFGYSDNFNILIMELLDKTIENVFEKNNHNFSIKTTCILAIQLVRIKFILYLFYS
jgi:predicted Ser/Thr protein kinase